MALEMGNEAMGAAVRRDRHDGQREGTQRLLDFSPFFLASPFVDAN